MKKSHPRLCDGTFENRLIARIKGILVNYEFGCKIELWIMFGAFASETSVRMLENLCECLTLVKMERRFEIVERQTKKVNDEVDTEEYGCEESEVVADEFDEDEKLCFEEEIFCVYAHMNGFCGLWKPKRERERQNVCDYCVQCGCCSLSIRVFRLCVVFRIFGGLS